MARHQASAALVALTLLLGACAGPGGATVSRVDVQALYSPGLMQWIGGGRDLDLRVTGNPTRVAPAMWEESIAEAMNATAWLPDTNITTMPDDTARGNFHISVVFNAPAALDGRSLCLGQVAPETLLPDDGTSRIAMALCNHARPVSSAWAATAPILAPGAPQLQAALGQLMRQIFPRRDPLFPDRADVFPLP